MASKTRYTEEFKNKVVEEIKKDDLSLDALADKYGLSTALLKYWIDNERLNDFYITLTDSQNKKESFFKEVKRYALKPIHWVWKNRWLITCCIALLFIAGVLFNLRSGILESEKHDNQQPVLQKLDSLIMSEREVKEQLKTLETLNSVMSGINEELEFRITPLMNMQSKKPVCNCKKDTVK